MSTRIQSAAAGALALLVAAIATPSAAGVVVQTKSFEHRQSLTTHLLNYNVVEDAPFNLHFDPFNGALGVLTGVSWTLDSTRKYEVGVSTLGGDVAYLLGENLVTSVKFGASPLGSGEDIGPMGPVACVANGAPACSALFQAEDDFDFDVAAANTFGFQQPGGVDAAFLSRLSLVGLALGDNVKNATAASSLRWDGNLSLTYTYRALTGPPPVIHPGLAPEPTSWALFFLGFGTAGAALRRRRETPAARDAGGIGRRAGAVLGSKHSVRRNPRAPRLFGRFDAAYNQTRGVRIWARGSGADFACQAARRCPSLRQGTPPCPRSCSCTVFRAQRTIFVKSRPSYRRPPM